MSRNRDYLVTIQWTGNEYVSSDLYKDYKIILVKGCSTLNEVNTKIYKELHLQKSKWEIIKIEKLKSIVEVI